ncbi:MAG: serine/threonine-protein kinase [Oscillatoriaceae bacterium SKW80]|nr:serine/threonine-protein kinase [Oscillatoriaceae bacterium SKYG93]MCX8122401.1 serine/threonine-protein kinase [Oscillatoriaceae bacterium SKW80]MDW8452674.1 serine/threonine-protein kinase [Oscillatoriaceae cyanobacterium SKYGB_i_bin93]HIK28001.1 tetratricopeptide repeat protein [Oscillatoriaceae cyanobacterium M7585_C2015_266]
MSYCLNPDCQKPQNPAVTKFCLNCGSKLLLGERYRAIKPIGQGGFGRTFLAIDEYKPSQPRCVIKQFFPQTQGTSNAEKAAELFTREAQRLDELGKHPQIPELLAHFQQEGRQYLVQEFIDGQNLSQELASKGVFNEFQILQLLKDLLPVLQFVHSKQVIHRDIKPENIIRRSADGKIVLVDFGASKFASQTSLEKLGTVIGSVGFAAPEQITGKALAASDLYSLGVTCIYLMTNKSPLDLFDAERNIWGWRYYLQEPVSESFAHILDKLLQPALEQRYQSAAEVLQDLTALSSENSAYSYSATAEKIPYQSASNSKNATKNLSFIAKILGGTPQVLTGKIMQSLGNYEKALDLYDRAIQINPRNYDAWYKKGCLYWELQRYEKAIICYEKTLEIKPDHYEAWRSLGTLLYSLQRYEEAVFSYDKALQIYPHQPTLWLWRSMALKLLGKSAEAQISFAKAKEILPANSAEKAAILLEAWENLIKL